MSEPVTGAAQSSHVKPVTAGVAHVMVVLASSRSAVGARKLGRFCEPAMFDSVSHRIHGTLLCLSGWCSQRARAENGNSGTRDTLRLQSVAAAPVYIESLIGLPRLATRATLQPLISPMRVLLDRKPDTLGGYLDNADHGTHDRIVSYGY